MLKHRMKISIIDISTKKVELGFPIDISREDPMSHKPQISQDVDVDG